MYREWSIADGPAVFTQHDVGQTYPFTVLRPNGTPWRVLIDITDVRPSENRNSTFAGRLHYDREIIAVIGTYNTDDLSGHCHTTDV